jgi:hypothetical protein
VFCVESLRRRSWIGRTGEDGVALMSRRCEFCREGALSRRKVLFSGLFRSRPMLLKLIGVSTLPLLPLQILRTYRFVPEVATASA